MTASSQIVASFATACGGVWIEEKPTPLGTYRAWRFVGPKGKFAEWADLDEVNAGRPRWYGSCFESKDFILC